MRRNGASAAGFYPFSGRTSVIQGQQHGFSASRMPPGRVELLLLFLLLPFFISAQAQLDSLRNALENESDVRRSIELRMQLARQMHHREHDEAEEYRYSQEAIQAALNLEDPLLYARSLDHLGLLHRYHQHYGEALLLHSKAFELVKEREVDPVQKMIYANNAGVAARYHQKYDQALSFYMAGLKIAEDLGDLRNIAISSNGIGNTLGNIPGREKEALAYFERSLKTEQERDNSLGVAMNYLSISDYYIHEHDFVKAREYLQTLLQINREREDLYGLAITYEFLGKSYLVEDRDIAKAASYFSNALYRFRGLRDRHKEAELTSYLGDIQRKQQQPEQAMQSYQASLELARELNHHGLTMQNSFKLSEVLEQQNQPARALQLFKQGKSYEDSIKLSEQRVEIASIIQKYDLEQKENHIQLLQKDKALQQTLLENQQQQLNRRWIIMVLLGLGFLFVLIIFILQYRNHQTRKKINERVLKEEKEKIKAIYERNLAQAEILVTRLQVNPHFLFNSLNAISYLIQTEQNAIAVKYLVVFSRYTRMVLETSQKHVVPLSEELKLTRYYLALEENRFKQDFSYEILGDEESGIGEIHIPPLLLQPFIENAIWHGLLPSKRKEKVLQIRISRRADGVEISIEDNGVGRRLNTRAQSRETHKSMGMEITRERIALYNKTYSGKIDQEIIDKKDAEGSPMGTRVVLKIKQSVSSVKMHGEQVSRVEY